MLIFNLILLACSISATACLLYVMSTSTTDKLTKVVLITTVILFVILLAHIFGIGLNHNKEALHVLFYVALITAILGGIICGVIRTKLSDAISVGMMVVGALTVLFVLANPLF